VSILGKFDMDARIAAQRIAKLDPARWQFLHLLLQARLQRRARPPLCHVRSERHSPFADQLQHSFSIHRGYDATVCYQFYAFGHYCRKYSRQFGYESYESTYKQWYLHACVNKYSCYVSEDSDSEMSDSDTLDWEE
jgi:hypothetical protein